MNNTLATYQKLCTEFYDLELEHSPDAQAVLAFYLAYAKAAHGPILEPMCGSGRFLIPMLQAGCDIQGFDASEHMLEALRHKYATINDKTAPVWQQLVQDFTSSTRYNLIFVPFGSWGLITDLTTSQQCLNLMYEHLAVGGTLLLEIETVASVPEHCDVWCQGANTRADGSTIALNTLASYNWQTQMFSSQCRYDLIVNGIITESESETFEQYVYRFDEMDAMLRSAGFASIKKYQDYAKTVATDASAPIIIYECVK